jgi:hypothetical protein
MADKRSLLWQSAAVTVKTTGVLFCSSVLAQTIRLAFNTLHEDELFALI